MIVIDMHMLICTHLCLQDMFSNTPNINVVLNLNFFFLIICYKYQVKYIKHSF
jgi:hypothetical protein